MLRLLDGLANSIEQLLEMQLTVMRARCLENGGAERPSSVSWVASNVAAQRRFRQDHVVRTSSLRMADRLELVALALPADAAPESLPATVNQFIAACWSGMSHAQLLGRARRLGLRASLRVHPEQRRERVRQYALVLAIGEVSVELIAHVRKLAHRGGARRAKVSLPPVRDARQRELF
ncbi:hypothetical protein [Paraburkholderia youngii]|uniref:hypothetical protein n=1 Tax=Paraburkholderia youngii TaxID=2782701 RepID=UPI003D257B62